MIAWEQYGTFSVAGKRLEYACVGPDPSRAPTIILLHEGLGCVALWKDFPAELSKATDFGVFVYSRAGYGSSDPADLPRPIDYMSQEALEILPEVLSEIGIMRGILVGHSDGATIAAIYLGSVTDHRVRGAILMAPHFFTEGCGLEAIAHSRDQFEAGGLRKKLARYHADPDNAFFGWNDAWLNPDFKDWDETEVIDYIRVPVLAIQGVDDQYGTLAQIEILQSKSYAPVDTLILEDCKHAPHMEQAPRVLNAIADFTRRLEQIEAA